jgi:hypothetical protein
MLNTAQDNNYERYLFVRRAHKFWDPKEPASIFRVSGGSINMQIDFYKGLERDVFEVFLKYSPGFQYKQITKKDADAYQLPDESGKGDKK